jgi:predicted nucleotidyltransferase
MTDKQFEELIAVLKTLVYYVSRQRFNVTRHDINDKIETFKKEEETKNETN